MRKKPIIDYSVRTQIPKLIKHVKITIHRADSTFLKNDIWFFFISQTKQQRWDYRKNTQPTSVRGQMDHVDFFLQCLYLYNTCSPNESYKIALYCLSFFKIVKLIIK